MFVFRGGGVAREAFGGERRLPACRGQLCSAARVSSFSAALSLRRSESPRQLTDVLEVDSSGYVASDLTLT